MDHVNCSGGPHEIPAFTFWVAAGSYGICSGIRTGTRLLRRPSVSRELVAFAYGGELWVVSRNGGAAWRLTATPEVESDPCISPDGSRIAYTATIAGNTDGYLMAAQGGNPTRLTYHPEVDVVRGWTPDSRSVVFASSRDTAPSTYASSYLRLDRSGVQR